MRPIRDMRLLTGYDDTESLEEVTDYLVGRGLAGDSSRAAEMLGEMIALPARTQERRVTVAQAAKYFYMSRRSLGRWCTQAGLPPPSHILAFGRVLRTLHLVRKLEMTIRRASAATGWPDPFSMSNAMHRLTGLRPSDARRQGLIYVAEAWLQEELAAGAAELRSPAPPTCPSCGQEVRILARVAEGGPDD